MVCTNFIQQIARICKRKKYKFSVNKELPKLPGVSVGIYATKLMVAI